MSDSHRFLDHATIPTMTDAELLDTRATIKNEIDGITNQLGKTEEGWIPNVTDTDAWAIRARDARCHLGRSLTAVRCEITKRRLAYEATNPRETPEQKAARIAASDQARKTQTGAFVKASYLCLSKQECADIWDFAREMFPECFVDELECLGT